LGSANASYLPLRLTPSAMGPLLMGSLLSALLPGFIGMAWAPAGAALGSWLARPLGGPRTTAAFIIAAEAAATVGREGPAAMAEWMAAAEVGVRGVPPGADTEALLINRTRATRLAGAAILAALYLSAAAFDGACTSVLGAAPASSALLLAAGFVASAQRQVAALVAAPRLERSLAEERRAVRALFGAGCAKEGAAAAA
jgi:preprotein translocase subunit SecY